MRKIFCIFLSLSVILSLAACSRPQDADPINESSTSSLSTTHTALPTESTAPEGSDSLAPIISQPMVSVFLPLQSEPLYSDDGNVLLNYNTQYMILSTTEQEVADRITLEFLNRIDSTTETKDAILDSAKSAYTSSGKWTPYQYTIAYTPKRVDSGVMSLLGCDVRFLGAHIEKIYESVNYSMTTGLNLSLLNIISNQDHINTLCQYVIEELNNNRDQLSLYEDFEDTVSQHFSNGVNDAWYFSPDGLCFFFSPYDIAPYSAGVVVAEIPYEKLVGILKDDYFPAERANAPGRISLLTFTEECLQNYSEYAELSLATNEDKFLLCTDGTAYDIQISVGTRSGNGMFIEEYTAFALSCLSSGAAIIVEADITAEQVLQIKYCSGDQVITAYIVFDPETNQITLTENE